MAQKKIVVIDDSPIALAAVRDGLSKRGFDVVALESPIGAAIVIGRERPDAVLVDITMASMSGEAVVKALKQRHRTGLRVLLFSDRAETELQDATSRSGADGYVKKTADLRLLADAIEVALR